MPRPLSEDELHDHETRLARDGFTIVERLLTPDETDAVAAGVQPLQDATPFGEDDFVGFKTRRVFNLINKTRVLDALMLNADVLRLLRSQLGEAIQLSIASTMEIFPGETPQPLHQDDAYWKFARPHPPLVLNTIWALTEFTEANGATRVVPGSQTSPRKVDIQEPSIATEMPKGSVMIWDGAVWHGGGANSTDDIRFGLSLNFCRGWIRQQENQYLAMDRDVLRALPRLLQRLLGWDNAEFLGYVDRSHPLATLREA